MVKDAATAGPEAWKMEIRVDNEFIRSSRLDAPFFKKTVKRLTQDEVHSILTSYYYLDQ